MDIYIHVLPELVVEAVQGLDDLLNGARAEGKASTRQAERSAAAEF